jgi:hypothetical protein
MFAIVGIQVLTLKMRAAGSSGDKQTHMKGNIESSGQCT